MKGMNSTQIGTKNLRTCYCGKRDPAERAYERRACVHERDKKTEMKYEK